ncbi:NosD domain-containing protein [Halorarius halobius]|uniref:NosD domain-containing protein n=1 Tax=Halorarius halobius TaxID=2962671 RepID=UPI0020CE00DC|nr:NosD domain-containing protein [Halorarius halobius]
MRASYALGTAALLLALTGSAMLVGAGTGGYEPVPFRDTITTGLTDTAVQQVRDTNASIPRAEVFYAQYRYVVGYHGVTELTASLADPATERQLGRPLAVYVSDYTGTGVHLQADGTLAVASAPGSDPGWVRAPDAVYVVDSRARTPAGAAVVPFADPGTARAFADEYGGEVVDWATVRDRTRSAERLTEASFRADVRTRTAWADERVAAARPLLDRPVSVTVGEDAPTLAAAIAAAPPNTTVRLPPGTYAGPVTVDKPLTLRGAGNDTHVVGPGNGTVVRATTGRVAVADLAVSGVGPVGSPDPANVSANASDWDYRVQIGYGYGDAGVALVDAPDSYVRDVYVRTPADGVLARDADGSVVENLTVRGSDEWTDGFMGVMAMRSRLVVQDSTFVGGRDGVYTHLADGIVVRDSHMSSQRFGVHLMYTNDALLANNTARDDSIGLVVMTRVEGNALVGNDVRESGYGISVDGAESFVADNVVVNNREGIGSASVRSRYTGNLVADNEVGMGAGSLLPTNYVVGNDFVDNDRHAAARLGPLRVWTHEGRGNYWANAPGLDRNGDGVLDRSFRATGAVDGRVDRAAGARTLAHSPALAGVRVVRAVVPGLGETGVVDTAPLARPVDPERVASYRNATGGVPA